MNARILLADDEPDLTESVSYALRREGFDVDVVGDGKSALIAVGGGARYDIAILDVMMPKLTGLEVCRMLRSESDLPIIMLTARDAEVDRVLGLELGADDYLTKPFSLAELVSRVRALLRRRELDRTAASAGPTRVLGGLELDLVRHRVVADGQPIQLTPSEFRLLALLAEHPEQVFSRREIMEHLWETPYVGDQRACDVHVSHLRRKIERDPAHPERIVTVREVGYKLVPV
ncbi:MAG: winged helix-turn-helix domain-containing protein [Verrucomicrobiota bacterium]